MVHADAVEQSAASYPVAQVQPHDPVTPVTVPPLMQ
jgi:hypothetical protein